MAPCKMQTAPETTPSASLQAKSTRVTKPTSTTTKHAFVRRSARLAEKSYVHPVRRYKNGLLNLESTPLHLVKIAKRNSTASPLLRIPPEIRNKIWGLTMGYQYIEAPGSQVPGTPWNRPIYTKKGGAMRHPAGGVIDWIKFFLGEDDILPRNDATRLPSAFHLPEVSRQIYAETATLGYKLNRFIVSIEHLNYKNCATGLLPAYRKAIIQIEPDPEYLQYLANPRCRPLKLRTFPGLSSIIISDAAMTYIAIRRRPGPRQELRDWIEAAIRTNHGDDIEVIFEEDEA